MLVQTKAFESGRGVKKEYVTFLSKNDRSRKRNNGRWLFNLLSEILLETATGSRKYTIDDRVYSTW